MLRRFRHVLRRFRHMLRRFRHMLRRFRRMLRGRFAWVPFLEQDREDGSRARSCSNSYSSASKYADTYLLPFMRA